MERIEKYPRTPHLPWSPGATSDDKRMDYVALDILVDRAHSPLVITEKMDGSNVCLGRDYLYARSHEGPPSHASFSPLKALHAGLRYLIPSDTSVYAEYVYAVHSIEYEALPAYVLIFGVRHERYGFWWSWEEVESMALELGLPTVPVLVDRWHGGGVKLLNDTQKLAQEPSVFGGPREGMVVRTRNRIYDRDEDTHRPKWGTSIAKWVRANHVQTSEHWTNEAIRPQKLRVE